MSVTATIESMTRSVATQYHQLAAAQRRIVIAAISVLGMTGVYFLLLQPALQFSQRAQTQLIDEAQLFAYVTQHADQIRQVTAARKMKTGQDTSLLALASNTAAEHALTIQRSEPSPDGKLAVWLSDVEFNQLLIWLDQLTNQYNIQIERVSISQSDKPAIVEAQLLLK